MNIHISDVNFNFQFSQKLNGHNIHSPITIIKKWDLPLLYPGGLVWCRTVGWFMPKGKKKKCVCMHADAG